MKFETRDKGKGKSLRCQTFANEKFILIAGDIFYDFFFLQTRAKKKITYRAKK